MRNPFRYFNSSPEVIGLVVMMYIRYPLSLRRVPRRGVFVMSVLMAKRLDKELLDGSVDWVPLAKRQNLLPDISDHLRVGWILQEAIYPVSDGSEF